MPLTATHLITGPSSHVRLTNTGQQPITAWSLAVVTHAEGGRTHREVETADGYLSEITHGLPGASERLERLMPGESRDITLDPVPDGAEVDVVAVVLDDATAVGDEPLIASIFAKRALERDALHAVVDAFNDVLSSKHGQEALSALQERLTVIAQRDASIPCRAAIDAVQTYARKGSAEEIDQSLRGYAAFVTREYQLAAKHSQRKQA
jgi:hypothetical protein